MLVVVELGALHMGRLQLIGEYIARVYHEARQAPL
jgi:hypothetical protein